jgi:squalene cyclase
MITPEAEQAIDRGLSYLARSQGEDGSWGDRPMYAGNLAVVGLGGLAFLAGGHQPGRGQYGQVVGRALRFVLSKEQTNPVGFLFNRSGSEHGGPMYSHGFATMFLAESHGTIADRDLRRRVRDTLGKAVKVILDSQNNEGGWRYLPEKKQTADISVTVCQIMALRAARNAGVEVPKSAVDKCIEYVRACQNADGGFRYFKQGGDSAFARSAAGLAALYSAGVYQGQAVDRGLKYLTQFRPNGTTFYRRDADRNYLYGHYYAAQVMWTAGRRWWADWFPAIRDELVSRSRLHQGAWQDTYFGADYATAMACIILQIPNNYLPIMQK